MPNPAGGFGQALFGNCPANDFRAGRKAYWWWLSIPTELNLTLIPAGRCTLALKREPEDWRYFPLQVR